MANVSPASVSPTASRRDGHGATAATSGADFQTHRGAVHGGESVAARGRLDHERTRRRSRSRSSGTPLGQPGIRRHDADRRDADGHAGVASRREAVTRQPDHPRESERDPARRRRRRHARREPRSVAQMDSTPGSPDAADRRGACSLLAAQPGRPPRRALHQLEETRAAAVSYMDHVDWGAAPAPGPMSAGRETAAETARPAEQEAAEKRAREGR